MSQAQSSSQSFWPSQVPARSTGQCSACHVARQLNKDGTVHQHGPRNDRCQGSNKPPIVSYPQTSSRPVSIGSATPLSVQSPAETSQAHPTPFAHPQCLRRIIKHIPRSARPHCAGQLAEAITGVTRDPCDQSAWHTLLHFSQSLLL